MSYTALYRKFRPDNFNDVKGQEPIVTTLKNQLKAERIGHAYLFCGSRGTGKTTVAKILAKAVNCENPQEGNPCGVCKSCRTIAAGASMNVIEIDAASNNGVDNIREIVEEVSYSPAEGRYKVYIIDEVHMLSIGAFNALLKTLEEPPSYVIFILATTEVHKIPITILSRCQRYDFKRISADTITQRMHELMAVEQTEVEEKALRYIAKAADGSMRDALSLLDQCIAFHFGDRLTYDKVLDVLGAVDTSVFSRMLRMILKADVVGGITLLEELIMQGRELTQFTADFTWYLRNLLLAKTSDQIEDVIDMSSDNLQKLKEEAAMAEPDTILRYIRIFSELSDKIRYASQKRILLETTVVKLCRPEMEAERDTLADRIRRLEERLEKGVVISGQSIPISEESPQEPKEPEKIRRPQLPKAIPEEVKQLAGKWKGIVESTQMPVKQYLRQARMTLGEGNKVVLVFSDGIASDYFTKGEEHIRQLSRLLSERIGKEVDVSVETIQEEQSFDDNYVDLEAVIHMDIEEE